MLLLIRSINLNAILFISTIQVELLMLRFIAIAIGSITIVSIAPKSEAMTANIQETVVTMQSTLERFKLLES